MRELTPKEGVGTENGPEMTERQITRFQREFQHSLLAAYTTYPRDFTLSDAFAEKAKLVLGTDLEVPTPAIVAVAQSVKLYADVLRSMPVVVEHSKEPDGPRKQEKIKENEPNELPGDDVAFCRKKRERPIASYCIIEKDERLWSKENEWRENLRRMVANAEQVDAERKALPVPTKQDLQIT